MDKVWFSASWFDIIQNNTPVAIDGYTNRYYSDGSKRAEGVELSLNGEITKNWSSYLSYTYTRTKNRTSGEVYPTIAPNALALWQKYRIDGGLLNGTVLGLGYRCKDSYYATFRGAKIADNYTIPSYSVFDFTGGNPPAGNQMAEGCHPEAGRIQHFRQEVRAVHPPRRAVHGGRAPHV